MTAWSFHARNTIMLDHSSKVPVTGDPLTDILRGLRLDAPDLPVRIDRAITSLALDMPGVSGADLAAAVIGAVPAWARA